MFFESKVLRARPGRPPAPGPETAAVRSFREASQTVEQVVAVIGNVGRQDLA